MQKITNIEKPFLDFKIKIGVLNNSIDFDPINKILKNIIKKMEPLLGFFNKKEFKESDTLECLNSLSDFIDEYCDTVETEFARSGVEFFVRTWPLNCSRYHPIYEDLIGHGFVEGFTEFEDGQGINIATNLFYFVDHLIDDMFGLDGERVDYPSPFKGLINHIVQTVEQLNHSLGKC